jgi:membrane protein DedA with SNARE-associated domain/membrane-associated phospholipid phosphatase
MIERLIEDIASGLGEWAYLLVAVMALAETAAFLGFVAPGEFTIIFGGVLAGEGTLSIELLIGITWASCVAGDAIGFGLGRHLGRGFVLRHGPRVRITAERFTKVEEFFRRHGGKAVFLGRWLGLIRPLMPFLAGASKMGYRRFAPYDVLSAGLWSATWCLLGYIFWRSFSQVASTAGRGTLAFAILLGLFVGVYQAIKHLRHPEERKAFAQWLDRQTQRPLLRPLGWVGRGLAVVFRPLWRYVLRPLWLTIAPPLRFLVARLTPGELGIELTTLLAIAGVGIYTVILQINLLQTDALLFGDETALEVARDIETGFLTTVADVLAVVGRLWFVVLATAGACAYLLARRRAPEALALSAGLALTQITTQIIKGAVDRPRPGDGLAEVDGYAYPSGHASISVTYLAIAVVLSRTVPATWKVILVVAGTLLSVAIGLSRVYLRVHYLTDVIGGWSVGLALFSLCGTVALIVEYLRHNSRAAEPQPRPEWTASQSPTSSSQPPASPGSPASRS